MVNKRIRSKISQKQPVTDVVHQELWKMRENRDRKQFSLGEIKRFMNYEKTNKLKGHLQELREQNRVQRFFHGVRLRTEYRPVDS